MARKRTKQVACGIAEAERFAKRLRADIRKRARERPLLKALLKTAERLRERARAAAGRAEKYLHQIRMDLEVAPATGRAARRVRTRRAG